MRARFLLLAVLCTIVVMLILPRSEAFGATIWPDAAVPATVDSGPDSAVELGVKFRADSNGSVTGVRFYKAGTNTGTHTGSLWTLTGTRLATATFSNETASGWQQVNFATPVAISANTVYVASYHTSSGHYSCDQNFFAGAGVDSPPLHALANGVSGVNGVYAYGTATRFPNLGWNSSNYWVDVLFSATLPVDPPPPTGISMVQKIANVTSSAQNLTATLAAPVTAGNLIVVSLSGWPNLPAATAVSDTLGNSYNIAGNILAVQGAYSAIYYAANVKGGADAVTVRTVAAGGQISMVAAEFSGLDTVAPLVVSAGAVGSGTTPYSGIMTTSPAGDLVVGSGTHNGDTVTTAGAGMTMIALATEDSVSHQPLAMEYQVLSGSQQTAATFSLASALPWTMNGAAFRRPAQPGSDTTPPTVTTFTIPAAVAALTVPITGFTATDNILVTGYLVTESATKPAADNGEWSTSVPVSYTFASAGSKTLYAWAKDAAGNVSDSRSATVAITIATGGNPILIITSAANPFSGYYAEILLAEGLNVFTMKDVAALSADLLAPYDVVIMGEMPLTVSQVALLTAWVNSGGHLVAMRPDDKLAGLLGLTDLAATMSDAYLLVDTGSAPGAGIVNQTVQYHGGADLYALNGATSLATLYSSAATATASPAATLRSVGANGGQAAAFAYDLARSVVLTRQGNPAWSGQERDSFAPIRSDDLYYGAAGFDMQSDWVDLGKVAIPQADEQQRLLANLIIHMNQDKKPLPRFWYFPRSLPAVVVMTGDDHGSGGTVGRFTSYLAAGPPGCSVDNWECLRGTSYIYTGTPITNAQASSFSSAGFEVALHVLTNCADWTPAALESFYATQLSSWSAKYVGLPAPTTNRTHCIAWSDYVTQSAVELAHGIRLDANYYYWPPSWVDDNPGFFTGSGMPMRFADSGGRLIDVYQATTQMTDESGQSYPFTINTLLDRAIGPQGYYGAFVVNAHTDQATSSVSDAVVASARARSIPVVSARQLLKWLDGRNGSKISSLTWNGSAATFSVTAGSGANGLMVMVPAINGQTVTGVLNNGNPVPFTLATVKGIQYARFSAPGGTYQVSYGSDSIPPPPPPPEPLTGSFTVWPASALPGVVDTGPDSAVELGVKFRADVSGSVSGIRFYKAGPNTGTHTGNLWTAAGTRLATATFSNESASGWQQVDFSTPVPISADTVYVASYHTTLGHYSFNQNYFSTQGVDSPPLHAPANGVSGFNGVFAYGATGTFPSQGWNSSNYWVDVVFTPDDTSALIKTTAAPTALSVPRTLPVSDLPTLSAIILTPDNQRIAVGTAQQFTATGTYSDGSTESLTRQVTWTSSDINVVAVTTTGLVTAYSPGTATVAATLNGISGSTELTATEGVAKVFLDQPDGGGI